MLENHAEKEMTTSPETAVRRYNSGGFVDEYGLWVRWADYDAVAADLARANSNNTALYDSLERTIAERDRLAVEVERLRGALKCIDDNLLSSRVSVSGLRSIAQAALSSASSASRAEGG